MRSLEAFVICVALMVLGCAHKSTDYTGFWKRSCSDDFGVQIQRADRHLYSVSFCGPGGCSKPGEWQPNTRIEGDPRYRVVSARELGIERTDGGGYFTYAKCETDPTWIVTQPLTTEKDRLDCSPSSATEKGVLIAWTTDFRTTTQFGQPTDTATTTVESFRPVALLDGSSLID